ncbi:MAG: hypothetical protein K0U20_08705 [Proteobacteria bacterium]|nr:hypothetical protein [Pseudomonadota bacterium]
MSNTLFNNLSPSDLERVRNCPSGVPSMIDRINEANDKREEILLAVMAAGVPTNCIELIPPHLENRFDFFNYNLNLGFIFIRGI